MRVVVFESHGRQSESLTDTDTDTKRVKIGGIGPLPDYAWFTPITGQLDSAIAAINGDSDRAPIWQSEA
jgi:hypothetical protein